MIDNRNANWNNLPAIQRSLNKVFSKYPSFKFDGFSSRLEIANLATELCTAKNLFGSIEIVFRINALPQTGFTAPLIGFADSAGMGSLVIYCNDSGKLGASMYSGWNTQWTLVSHDAILDTDVIYHMILVQNGTTPALYLNGSNVVSVFEVSLDKTQWLKDITGTVVGTLGCDSSFMNYADVELFSVRTYNRALSQTDIVNNILGPVDNQYTMAMMDEHLEPTNPALWANTGDFSKGAGESDLIGYTYSADQTSEFYQLFSDLQQTVTRHKKYRFTYTVLTTGYVEPDNTVFTLENYAKGEGSTSTSLTLDVSPGTHHYEFMASYNAPTSNFVIQAVSNGATQGNFTMGDLRLIQVGCVSEYNCENICPTYWNDNMHINHDSKNLSAMINSSSYPSINNLPSDNKLVIIHKGVDADTTIFSGFPGGYVITKVIARNLTANSFDLTISAKGTTIVNAQTVGANATVDLTLAASITDSNPYDYGDLVFSSGAWNGASVNVTIIAERFN